jgi:hypothetical protein
LFIWVLASPSGSKTAALMMILSTVSRAVFGDGHLRHHFAAPHHQDTVGDLEDTMDDVLPFKDSSQREPS